jgi:purine-binding chemotaxis protein CheW
MVDNTDDYYDDLYDEDEEDTQKDKYITFRLGDEDYGIDIAYVKEIVGVHKITEVPDMPDFVKGVINLHGQVIPVMDVRLRFKMQPREYDDRTCVVVVLIQENVVGLIVDTVNEVRDIPESCVVPPPKFSKRASSRFIKGMGKVDEEVKILLDLDKILFDDELEQIQHVAE